MNLNRLTRDPITSINGYKALLKQTNFRDLQNSLTDLQVREQTTKLQLKEIRREIQRRKQKTAPASAGTEDERSCKTST
ncbi:MAG: hypothetical protein ACERKO_09490 [Acetanaerobacterium sp.]